MERTLLILWLERHAAALKAALEEVGEALPAEVQRMRVWKHPYDVSPPPTENDDPELWEWRQWYEPHSAVKRLGDELERLGAEIALLRKEPADER